MAKVTEQEAVFRSHIDGRLLAISPERRGDPGSPGKRHGHGARSRRQLPNEPEVIRDACERSIRWADAAAGRATGIRPSSPSCKEDSMRICAAVCGRPWRARFPRLRGRRLERGRTAGGNVSNSRSHGSAFAPRPAAIPDGRRPTGRPVGGGRRGIDLFDCVMPTRNGRNAMAFTDAGPIRLRNLKFQLRPASATRRLSVPCLSPEPGLYSAPIHGRRDARPDTAVDPQFDLLPEAARRRPPGNCRGPFRRLSSQKLAGWRGMTEYLSSSSSSPASRGGHCGFAEVRSLAGHRAALGLYGGRAGSVRRAGGSYHSACGGWRRRRERPCRECDRSEFDSGRIGRATPSADTGTTAAVAGCCEAAACAEATITRLSGGGGGKPWATHANHSFASWASPCLGSMARRPPPNCHRFGPRPEVIICRRPP